MHAECTLLVHRIFVVNKYRLQKYCSKIKVLFALSVNTPLMSINEAPLVLALEGRC